MKKIGIIGGGTMGSGIAQITASSNYSTTLLDISDELLEKSLSKIKKSVSRLVEKGKLTQEAFDNIISNIKTTTKYEELGECDLVIEAVSENKNIKKQVFQNIEKHINKNCIIASNTSTFPITELGLYTSRPDLFVGIHFFNPAPVMKLVEIIRSLTVSNETIEIAKTFAISLGKEPVIAKDRPGFIVNRILLPMINEAVFVFEEGVASAEDIDKAMQLGTNHPMGPLALTDLIGLDITLDILDVLYDEFKDPKYRAAPLLRQMVRAGRLGRKTGKGFFEYKK
ncbi:MAG: 3-hydroxybutyryl-CoA dehydrogenase [Candidatus Dadabacteria bacterium]|nr:3-hydroxybutyryl-CoA dehydrogenase [Candidatus Dadabacteria bacterium]NIQ13023.1 3-hydroxybutyryl-CoA dehydrogenase [Candidatus Dadabacteria bacterium]